MRKFASKLTTGCQNRNKFYLVQWPNGKFTHRFTEKDEQIEEDFLSNLARDAHMQHLMNNTKDTQSKESLWMLQPMTSSELKNLSDILQETCTEQDYTHSFLPILSHDIQLPKYSHNIEPKKKKEHSTVITEEITRSKDPKDGLSEE